MNAPKITINNALNLQVIERAAFSPVSHCCTACLPSIATKTVTATKKVTAAKRLCSVHGKKNIDNS